MYILTFEESERDVMWLSFDSIDAGRQFLNLLPGYRCEYNEKSGNIEREWIHPAKFPEYEEICFRGNKFPITKFMFKDWEETEIYFWEIPNLGIENQGFIEGVTTVDAYSIPHSEMQHYISVREKAFQTVKKILSEKGFETGRAYHGSQDGEAILYKLPEKSDWHFLGHMDPLFVKLGEEGYEALEKWAKHNLHH